MNIMPLDDLEKFDLEKFIDQMVEITKVGKPPHRFIRQFGGQYGGAIHKVFSCDRSGKQVMSSSPESTLCEHCGEIIQISQQKNHLSFFILSHKNEYWLQQIIAKTKIANSRKSDNYSIPLKSTGY